MEFWDVVGRRRMVRSYQPKPVSPELVDRVIDAGLRAPSAGNTRGVAMVVLADADDRARFWAAVVREPAPLGGRWDRLRGAPVVIVPLAHRGAYLARYAEPDKIGLGMDVEAGWAHPYWNTDAAFAVMGMLLAATDLGLGALFFALGHGRREAMEQLEVPGGHEPIGAMTLGWPAPDSASPSLDRPAPTRVHYGHWGHTRR